MIKISGLIELKQDSETHHEDIIEQIARDATYGTYGKLPESLENAIENFENFFKVETIQPIHGDGNEYHFILNITEDLFPIEEGGLQHFVSSVSGDLFNPQTPSNDILSIVVKDISWDGVKSKNTDNIDRIREAFYLDPLEPLLAFTFKPRFGLSTEKFIEISKLVFAEGFHIVEPDTRKILLDKEREQFIKFAKELHGYDLGQHQHSFSLNISNRWYDGDEIVSDLSKDSDIPLVIKIDGGLDGFTLMQKVKKRCPDSIVTCYPLLKNQLKNKIPIDFLNQITVNCGADIMYPGGRANIHDPVRRYESTDPDAINESVRKYRNYLESGTFIPTVAGGVTPSQLHVFYELYGPNVSYFLGGAVVLHKDGPKAGAKLCKQIFKHAVEFRKEHPKGDPEDLPKKLIDEIYDSYNKMEYISPKVFRQKFNYINYHFV